MKKTVLFLVIASFLFSTICLGAVVPVGTRAARNAITNAALQAQVDSVVGQYTSQGLGIDQTIARIELLKVNQPPQEVQRLNEIISTLRQATPPEDHAWIGDRVTEEQAARIAAKQGNVVALPDVVRRAVEQVMGPLRENYVIPEVKVVPQKDMEGIVGPTRSGNLVVIGDNDWRTMQVLPQALGHEFMAAWAAINNVEGAHGLAVQVERIVEVNLRPTQNTEGVVAQDVEQTYLSLRNLSSTIPAGRAYEFKLSQRLQGKAAIVDQYIGFLRSRLGEGNVEVRYTLPADGSLGDIVVRAYPSTVDKQTVLGQSRVDVSGEPYRIAGLLNIGFISANIPENLTSQNIGEYQPLLDTLRQQYRVVTTANLQLPPTPPEIGRSLRRLTIALPRPEGVNFDTRLEEEMTRKIFAAAA